VKDLLGPAVPGWRETEKYLLDLEDAFDTDENENQTRQNWLLPLNHHTLTDGSLRRVPNSRCLGQKRT